MNRSRDQGPWTDDRGQRQMTGTRLQEHQRPDRYSYRYNAVHSRAARPDNRTVTRYGYMHSQTIQQDQMTEHLRTVPGYTADSNR